MKTIKRIWMFIVALIATTGAWADELTVFDGDDVSNNVPVYGYYADNYLKCEVVMPADELTAMAGGTISAMKFHTYAPASAQWGAANFVVFLKEISGTILNAYKGSDNATIVYEGGLDGTGETMNVEFTNPYVYQGGNLLIGVYCTATGSYKSISFKGTTVDGASVQGYSESSLDAVTCNQRNFIPKTTFTYTPGEIDTSLALSVIETEHGAIELTVGGVVATKAEAGDEVLITATPENDDWAVKEIVAIPYIGWGGAQAPRRTPEILKIELTPVEGSNNQWTFEMPAYPVKVKATFYYARFDIVFTTTGEYTIQDGYATVAVDGDDVTEDIDQTGTLPDVAENSTVTITAEPGFKLANVTASYKEKPADGFNGNVIIGRLGEATNNSYLPMNSLYNYSYTQQIYTAEEIGQAGTISAITVWLYGNDNLYEMPYDIYMVETDKETFESNTDWITVAESDKVCTGTVTVHNTEAEAYTFKLDTPFEYSGTGNLVVCFLNKTGMWTSGLNGMVFGANTDPVRSIYFRNDNTLVDPTNPTVTATSTTYARNVMQIEFGDGGGSGELTVHNGSTTNGFVPVYGYYADAYLKSEFVMPAAELADMAGSDINSMKFYAQQSSVNWGAAEFQVFLTEVADETISAFNGPGTVVYEGALSIVDGEMNIEFTTPYHYNGGNLLIGFYETATGSFVTSTWVGETVNGASVQGYSYSSLEAISATQHNFIPKTTFTYSGDSEPINVDLAADGSYASFTVPEGIVTVVYELERLGTPVEVAAGKYITYYTDKDVVILDEDFELLTVTAVDETTVTATPIEVAAAETPLLVYNSSDEKKTIWIVPTEEIPYTLTPDVIDVAPEFKGTLEEKTFTAAEMSAAKHFVCNGETFMLVRREGTIGANKCWLELSNDAPQNARTIVIGTAETTGIADVNRETITNNRYYDLQGRRVMQPAKGLYINNGKKVMIK